MIQAGPQRFVARWVIAALGMLIIVGIFVNVTMPRPFTRAPGSAPELSADLAVRAGQRILAESATHEARQPADRMSGVLTAANAELGSSVFGHAAMVGHQELDVSVNADAWNALTDSDRNELFAAMASTWATLWEQAHPRGTLEEGTILRVIDKKGNEIRNDVFRRP